MLPAHNPSNMLNMIREPRDIGSLDRRAHKRREKHTLHDPGVLPFPRANQPQQLVRHVSGMIMQGPRDRMRPDHRRLGQLDSLPGSLVARVRQVDQQTQAVELGDELPPQVREAVALVAGRAHWLAEPGGAGEGAVAHVREADVADAELCEQADCREGVAKEVCSLHPEQAGDLARLEGGAYVLR